MNGHPARVVELDPLESGILRALHADGRASWGSIAETVQSSTSTVRRRFESLLERGLIRVIGRTDVARLGRGVPSMVQLRGRESSHPELLRSLQERNDARYLSAVIGSAGCIAEIVTPSLLDLHTTIAQIARDFDVNAEPFVVTHTYTSGQDWLPESAPRSIEFHSGTNDIHLSSEESIVLGMLLRDGRTSLGELAAGIGKSESTARRVMDSLCESNVLSFRVLVEPQTLGFKSEFWVWFDVEPSHQAAVGKTLAANKATKTLIATAGRYNLVGQFVLPRHTDVHAFDTEVLGSLVGLRSAELMLHAATYKRVWNRVDGQRYTDVVGPDWLFGHESADSA